MTVLEVAAESSHQESTPIILLEKDSLAGVAKTWDISTTCRRDTNSEQEANVEILDFSQVLPTIAEQKYDVLISSNIDKHVSDSLEELERMCKVVKPGGTMCLLATETVLVRIQPYLDALQMETTVLHSVEDSTAAPSHYPALVIAKKGVIPQTNGKEGANGAEAILPQITLVQAANPTELAQAVASQLSALLEEQGYGTEIFFLGLRRVGACDKVMHLTT